MGTIPPYSLNKRRYANNFICCEKFYYTIHPNGNMKTFDLKDNLNIIEKIVDSYKIKVNDQSNINNINEFINENKQKENDNSFINSQKENISKLNKKKENKKEDKNNLCNIEEEDSKLINYINKNIISFLVIKIKQFINSIKQYKYNINKENNKNNISSVNENGKKEQINSDILNNTKISQFNEENNKEINDISKNIIIIEYKDDFSKENILEKEGLNTMAFIEKNLKKINSVGNIDNISYSNLNYENSSFLLDKSSILNMGIESNLEIKIDEKNIKDYYVLIDKFDSIKNIKNNKNIEPDNIILYFLNNNKIEKNIYHKKDLVENYFFIDIIVQNNEEIKILLPKGKININDKNLILNELKNYNQIFLEKYKINFKDPNIKICAINKNDNKYKIIYDNICGIINNSNLCNDNNNIINYNSYINSNNINNNLYKINNNNKINNINNLYNNNNNYNYNNINNNNKLYNNNNNISYHNNNNLGEINIYNFNDYNNNLNNNNNNKSSYSNNNNNINNFNENNNNHNIDNNKINYSNENNNNIFIQNIQNNNYEDLNRINQKGNDIYDINNNNFNNTYNNSKNNNYQNNNNIYLINNFDNIDGKNNDQNSNNRNYINNNFNNINNKNYININNNDNKITNNCIYNENNDYCNNLEKNNLNNNNNVNDDDFSFNDNYNYSNNNNINTINNNYNNIKEININNNINKNNINNENNNCNNYNNYNQNNCNNYNENNQNYCTNYNNTNYNNNDNNPNNCHNYNNTNCNNYNDNNPNNCNNYNNIPNNCDKKSNIVYLFTFIGLNNVGSTCFMHATLQCLLHISELSLYFLNEYPNDFQMLNSKNSYSPSKGDISMEYYKVVEGVYLSNLNNQNNTNYFYNSFSPKDFKKTLGSYNLQFSKSEANDSKDLILYLLQTFHEELNYFGDQLFPKFLTLPNQLNRPESYLYFMNSYHSQNLSIISTLFYGTYENTTKCLSCQNIFYNYQQFEFISFSTRNYANSFFDIYFGFRDNEAIQYLNGNNQYFCNICHKFSDAEICCRIITPPTKLLINIDYGKDKIYEVNRLKFDEIINITKYVNFDFGNEIKYQISGICTHLGFSGSSGHYVAYCRHKQTGRWYNFNDSFCRECSKNEIYKGSPYLLLYEKI